MCVVKLESKGWVASFGQTSGKHPSGGVKLSDSFFNAQAGKVEVTENIRVKLYLENTTTLQVSMIFFFAIYGDIIMYI